ncbi:hypothetical protein KCP73_25695 [Salmonella enterica subsp. enterica]|nr:hypothetical protein KCP73_25695 [Salmonella enterica subsp. enterica]
MPTPYGNGHTSAANVTIMAAGSYFTPSRPVGVLFTSFTTVISPGKRGAAQFTTLLAGNAAVLVDGRADTILNRPAVPDHPSQHTQTP